MCGYDGGCAALGEIKKKSRKSLLLQRPATIHKSDRRGSNPRSRPWQGRALPTTPLSLAVLLFPREYNSYYNG